MSYKGPFSGWLQRRRRRSSDLEMMSFGPRSRAFRNTERELSSFRMRVLVAGLFVVTCFGLLLARFVWLQVVKHEELYARGEANRTAHVPVTANRGLIRDRNGVLIARNYAGYTLEIYPRKVESVPAVIDELAKVVDIQPRDRRRFKKLQDELKNAESVPIRTKLSD